MIISGMSAVFTGHATRDRSQRWATERPGFPREYRIATVQSSSAWRDTCEDVVYRRQNRSGTHARTNFRSVGSPVVSSPAAAAAVTATSPT